MSGLPTLVCWSVLVLLAACSKEPQQPPRGDRAKPAAGPSDSLPAPVASSDMGPPPAAEPEVAPAPPSSDAAPPTPTDVSPPAEPDVSQPPVQPDVPPVGKTEPTPPSDAPGQYACSTDADCVSAVAHIEGHMCCNYNYERVQSRRFVEWREAWQRRECAGFDCVPIERLTLPAAPLEPFPPCYYEPRCKRGFCLNACPPPGVR